MENSILENSETTQFLRRTARVFGPGYVWERDLNQDFVNMGVGVRDYRNPAGTQQIDVFPIGPHNFEDQNRDGRLFLMGCFKPESYKEVEEILRRNGYRFIDKVRIC